MLKPTQDYVLVKPVRRTQSDVLEVISREKFTQATVIAVGPGKHDKHGRLRPLTVKPGDFVTYGDLNRGYDFYPAYAEEHADGTITVYRILQEADVCFIAEADHPAHQLPDRDIAELMRERGILSINIEPMPVVNTHNLAGEVL